MFSRNGASKTPVSDNAPKWCSGKDDTNHKNGPKACSLQKVEEIFLPSLLLSYRIIIHVGRLESSSALMGKQIRDPLMMSYSIAERMWTKRIRSQVQKSEFSNVKKS